jgi:hypothetical protein
MLVRFISFLEFIVGDVKDVQLFSAEANVHAVLLRQSRISSRVESSRDGRRRRSQRSVGVLSFDVQVKFI